MCGWVGACVRACVHSKLVCWRSIVQLETDCCKYGSALSVLLKRGKFRDEASHCQLINLT